MYIHTCVCVCVCVLVKGVGVVLKTQLGRCAQLRFQHLVGSRLQAGLLYTDEGSRQLIHPQGLHRLP